MVLGEGLAKIQLCDSDGVEQYARTLSSIEQGGLAIVHHPEILDTETVIEMDNGDLRKIVKGKRIKIYIPIRVIEDVTSSAWETFLYRIWDWEDKIKVTPYVDETGYAFWCILEEGRMSQRDVRNLREIDTLKFIGSEIIDEVS